MSFDRGVTPARPHLPGKLGRPAAAAHVRNLSKALGPGTLIGTKAAKSFRAFNPPGSVPQTLSLEFCKRLPGIRFGGASHRVRPGRGRLWALSMGLVNDCTLVVETECVPALGLGWEFRFAAWNVGLASGLFCINQVSYPIPIRN